QRVVVAPAIGLDVELDAADAMRAVADDRRRYEVPAELLRKQVGGVFALVERAVGEVPEGHLAASRLVDADGIGLAPEREDGGKAVVGAPGEHVAGGDLAVAEDALRLLGCEIGRLPHDLGVRLLVATPPAPWRRPPAEQAVARAVHSGLLSRVRDSGAR